MVKAKVQAGQTLTDIAVQYLGSAERVFELARLNEISVTEKLTNGQELTLSEVGNNRVVKFLADDNWHPAANLENTEITVILEGVDYWGVEYDFVIN